MFAIVPPLPLIILHAPVPTEGVFPAKVTDVTPQAGDWSAPANATDGNAPAKVITTLSVEVVQVPLLIVHFKVYAVPAFPEKEEVAELALAMFPPLPLIIVHAPVPTVGVFAASVAFVIPQVGDWSAPALAVVGDAPAKVIITLSLEGVHEPLLIVHFKV